MKAIVLGGSFAGVSAACALAKAGYETTLIDQHAYLGGDVASCQHTRVTCGEGGFPLDEPNGRRKMTLHARLKDAGVRILYMARCAGVFVDGERACGAAIATKYGVFALFADAVIDATESGVGRYHLTGCRAVPYEAEYGFDFERAEAVMEPVVYMPKELGLSGSCVLLTRTMRANTANVSFRFPVGEEEAADRTAIERRAHELMVKISEQLKKNSCLEGGQAHIAGSHTRLFYRDIPQDDRIGMVDAQLSAEFSMAEREKAEAQAAVLALDYAWQIHPAGQARHLLSAGREIIGWSVEACEEKDMNRLMFDAEAQGFSRYTADVIIAGAGTGGAMAGWALCKHGIDTLLVDNHYFCGGTNTVGKVYSAWHGYVDGMFAERARIVGAMPEAEVLSNRLCAMMMWEQLFAGSSARMIGGMTVCGAVREGRRIRAALLCGEEGFGLACGRFVIDGTADGDLCALAGVPFEVGGGRDGFVQTSSMWGHEYNRLKAFVYSQYNMDQDAIDPDSYEDLLRGIGLGYRANSEYEIVEMCMQRESRRFECRTGLTMAGIARRETHADDIAVGLCIHDTHGRPSSLMNTLSLFSHRMMEPGQKDIRIRMPLGMFLPKMLDNTALVGKSMCGEREAVALCRMNPDISNAGYAVGCAAAWAVLQGTDDLSTVELAPVQKELKEARVLPEWADNPGDRLGLSEALEALDDESDGGFAAMVQPKAEIVPYLKKALEGGGVRAFNAAMALAWHGEADGVSILIERLRAEENMDAVQFMQKNELDVAGVRADGFERVVNPNENYGYVGIELNDPDFSYSRINRLLVLIGLVGGDGLDEILDFAEKTEASWIMTGKTPYARSRIDTHRYAAEGRLFALAAAAERLADRRAAAALERIVDDPALAANRALLLAPPQCVLCEIAVARAALHCGSRKGAVRLAGYLSSPRSIFKKMALRALRETLPEGPDAEEALWMAYISSMDELPVIPWRGDPYCG